MYILNGNNAFGDAGPYNVDSIDALIDDMMPNITEWAGELAMDAYDTKVATEYHVKNMIDKIKEGLIILDNQVTIICDNGGGFTVQLPEWAHYYEGNSFHFTQAAEDIMAFFEHGNTHTWEGHEEDAMDLNPTDEQIRNGGYLVFYGIDELLSAESCWGNVRDLQIALQAQLR